MSYGCQQGGPDHYGGPQGYGLPLGQSNQGQHLPQGAPQGYPSQQGGFGYPPQSHYPLQSGYVDRPSEQFPPQGQWGAAPYDQFPPQGGFGGPPQQSFGPALVGMPSPGYGPNSIAQGDASQDADTLRRAMKGFGTDEDALILILSKQDVFHMALLVETYLRRFSRNLEADIASETSGDFKEGLLALVRGPRMQDVHLLHDALKGLGTKESLLNDVLLGRSNADLRSIKAAYQSKYGRSLEADVKSDLSLKTERLFSMVISATRTEESALIIPQDLDRDVTELHRATDGGAGTDAITVCSILSSRSDGQIRAISQSFHQKYRATLQEVIKKKFSGHMEDALLLMTERACDPAMMDAIQLEETMKGIGTRNQLLINRIVRIHWNRPHLDQVKRAYKHKYSKDLVARVRGETSRHFERLCVALLQS